MIQPAKQNVCPKCGREQIVCTYLGPLGGWHNYHGWRHDCTNPACGFYKTFHLEENTAAQKGELFPGPGKEGGCPGHK